jgi:hypothetical protein
VKRYAAAIAVAVVYAGIRLAPAIHLPLHPVAPVSPVAAPFADVAKAAGQLPAGERAAIRDAYKVLGRAVREDPEADPVFVDSDSVRRAHRAALLVVWKGVLGNKTGEAPGLREALEAAVVARIGSDDIPMNPQLKADTAKAFEDIAGSL